MPDIYLWQLVVFGSTYIARIEMWPSAELDAPATFNEFERRGAGGLIS